MADNEKHTIPVFVDYNIDPETSTAEFITRVGTTVHKELWNLKEQATRKALIAFGWTPPNGTDPEHDPAAEELWPTVIQLRAALELSQRECEQHGEYVKQLASLVAAKDEAVKFVNIANEELGTALAQKDSLLRKLTAQNEQLQATIKEQNDRLLAVGKMIGKEMSPDFNVRSRYKERSSGPFVPTHAELMDTGKLAFEGSSYRTSAEFLDACRLMPIGMLAVLATVINRLNFTIDCAADAGAILNTLADD